MDINYKPTNRKIFTKTSGKGELVPVATVDAKTWKKIQMEIFKETIRKGSLGVRVKYDGYYLVPEKP